MTSKTSGDEHQELSLEDVFRAIQLLQQELKKTKDDLTVEIRETVKKVVKEAVATKFSGIQGSLKRATHQGDLSLSTGFFQQFVSACGVWGDNFTALSTPFYKSSGRQHVDFW